MLLPGAVLTLSDRGRFLHVTLTIRLSRLIYATLGDLSKMMPKKQLPVGNIKILAKQCKSHGPFHWWTGWRVTEFSDVLSSCFPNWLVNFFSNE